MWDLIVSVPDHCLSFLLSVWCHVFHKRCHVNSACDLLLNTNRNRRNQ